MALNDLTLSVTAGVQGRPFRSKIEGLTAGSQVSLDQDAAPGFSTVNGFLTHQALPYPENVAAVRERLPSGETKVTRIPIAGATQADRKALALATLPNGRMLRSYRLGATRQVDGSDIWSVVVDDDLGGATSATVGNAPTPTPTPTDTIPNAFSFAPVTGASRSVLTSSPEATITGIDTAAPITITGGEYQIGAEAWTAASGTITNGQSVKVRLTSSASYSTLASATLAVGGVSATFDVTTAAVPVILPASQTVAFGAKTRIGYGGHPLGYTGTGTLSITAGNTALHWMIDSRNHLVCRTSASTAFGGAPPTFAGPYTLTVTDGVSSSEVTVNIVANAAHIRAMNSGANADFSYGSPVARGHQLQNALISGTLVLGDTIWCRDGQFAPNAFSNAATSPSIRPPAGLWPAGSGPRITIRSETVDTSVNATDGIPNRKHGFAIGGLMIDPSLNSNVEIPLTFEDISFYNDAPVAQSALLNWSGTGSWGVNAKNCGFEYGPNVVSAWTADGFRARSPVAVEYCSFRNVKKGLSTGGGATARWNDAAGIWEDMIFFGGIGNIIEDNFGHSWKFSSSTTSYHCDGIQHSGIFTGASQNIGSVRRNILIVNMPEVGAQVLQGLFFEDTPVDNSGTGAIESNLSVITAPNGIYLSRFTDPSVRNNTVVAHLDSAYFPGIIVPSGKSGTGGIFTRNVASAFALGLQTGATIADNVTLAKNQTAYDAAFAAYAGSGLITRAAVIAALKPKAGGSLLLGDGSYAGALKPDGSWNDGAPV